MATDSLASMAGQLLDHCRLALDQSAVVAAITALGVYAPGAPARSYVAHDIPAVDCEQLTVHVASVAPRLFERGTSSKCALVPEAQLCVQLWRCVSTVDGNTLPSAETLDNEGRALLIDGWALWKHLTGLWKEGTLLDGIACRNVTWGTLDPAEPQGGYAGWQLCLTVQVQ